MIGGMWQKLFGVQLPPADGDGDENDEPADYGDEELEEEEFIDDFGEDDEWAWVCRACLTAIEPTALTFDLGRARVHASCLQCAVCLKNISKQQQQYRVPGQIWSYCNECYYLTQMETALYKAADAWGCVFQSSDMKSQRICEMLFMQGAKKKK